VVPPEPTLFALCCRSTGCGRAVKKCLIAILPARKNRRVRAKIDDEFYL
jgi:hypothetical protein